MNREDLQLLLDKTPFAPFRVTLSTNEALDVRHPEMAMVTDRFIAVGRPIGEGDDRRILFYWISLQHIAHIHRL